LYRRASSRNDAEYAFRHALVREAAYAMLTDADRILGHQLAGEWLDRAGEPDALVLAEHFERGGVPDRAITAYIRAAEQALAGNDFGAALSRAERGVALGATGESRGLLWLVQADAHRWRGELVDAGTRADQALTALPVGTAAWFRATETVIMASGRRADYSDVIARARLVAQTSEVDAEARSARVSCLCEAGRGLLQTGRYDLAAEVASCVDELAGDLEGLESAAIVQIHRLRASRARHKGDLAGDLHGYRAVLAAFEGCGDLRNACNARVSVGFAFIELGDFARAEVELRRALADAERMVLDTVVTRARQNLALVVSYNGDHATAIAMLEQVIAESAAQGNQRFEAWTRIYLSMVSLAAGDYSSAAAEAELAAAAFAETPPARAGALAALARARVRQGRDGRAAAEMAMSILEMFSGIEEFESLVWLAMVEVARADGSPDASRWAARARVRIGERAASITDADLRASFLALPENAELAKS
jgi:tetratricopeptide (TPR) repeat protein